MRSEAGRSRVVIDRVQPEVDCGLFAIKRTVGEKVTVKADAFTDGHDAVKTVLMFRREGASRWEEVVMTPVGNDRWSGEFRVSELGRYQYCVEAWVDRFESWRRDLKKKVAAGQDVAVELLVGALLVEQAAERARPDDGERLRNWAGKLRTAKLVGLEVLPDELLLLMDRYPDRSFASRYQRALWVEVDREKARFSTWYEMFPRSCAGEPGRHGTLSDCAERLPYVAAMGFDVLYFPPIHPIGGSFRKGRNNNPRPEPGDPGSPWAIGSDEGGHMSVHPELGTLEDFRRLLTSAQEHGLELALDIAFQCSPDHPYVREHPEWFRRRPDGSIQYAENPPKKYQDIYPLDFESEKWRELWQELRNVVFFWIGEGVRIFRVDNPHTKPFGFWEWLIREVKNEHPDVIFLSEAFTRPKVMYRLAKLGFTQSYTYFSWRNTKHDLTEYFSELVRSEVGEFFRPNLWPNTPDILPEYLQHGGRPAFIIRLVLAATLAASYGVYGPAFELMEARPRSEGTEEYLDSEKYEVRRWTIDSPGSLRGLVARVNRIRRENAALQSNDSLSFHPVDNDQLICYSNHTEDRSQFVLMVVNLDPHHVQAGRVELPLDEMDLSTTAPYQVHDLLSDARYVWQGYRNHVELDPRVTPARIFQLRRRIRSEHDFDYYM